MNFLLDVHLPITLSKFLDKQTGCQAVHVNQILRKWHTTDAEICNYADTNNLVVISKDEDFKNTHFINHTPQKLIRVVLGNISNNDLIAFFAKYLPFIKQLTDSDNFYIELSASQLTVIV